MEIDPRYMARALQLAAAGMGNASPNPMVGAVVVGPDGTILGEGYHRRCGGPHAEVNAIASVRRRELLPQSTVYVTLEPCSHYGKTPPCAKLLIDSNVRRVVVGAADPFPQVAGRGVAMLRAAGIEVVEGVMEAECRALNARFMTAHTLQRPWVTLKWAQSSDGFLDNDRPNGRPYRFSNPLTTLLTHRLRSLHDAILVGSGTILADRPRLDCRCWPGHSPLPVVLDRSLRLGSEDFSTTRAPIVLRGDSLADDLRDLYRRGITSVLVEGGSRILHQFVADGLWDAARVEITSIRFGQHGSAAAPALPGAPVKSVVIEGNRVLFFAQNYPQCVKNL